MSAEPKYYAWTEDQIASYGKLVALVGIMARMLGLPADPESPVSLTGERGWQVAKVTNDNPPPIDSPSDVFVVSFRAASGKYALIIDGVTTAPIDPLTAAAADIQAAVAAVLTGGKTVSVALTGTLPVLTFSGPGASDTTLDLDLDEAMLLYNGNWYLPVADGTIAKKDDVLLLGPPGVRLYSGDFHVGVFAYTYTNDSDPNDPDNGKGVFLVPDVLTKECD